jgi:glycosyltransferase involved in cell wall biosynthesis
MMSVVIATHDSERLLVPTLAALVPGALSGFVREVIVADGGSSDATATVADVAGCEFVVTTAPLGTRLKAAAAATRSQWLLFLQPGTVPDAIWIDETSRFVQETELGLRADAYAAVFRPSAALGGRRPILLEALALIAAAFGALPRPGQGLLISKRLYERLGGHRADHADPERDLLRRIGRRRLVMLRSGAVSVAVRR